MCDKSIFLINFNKPLQVERGLTRVRQKMWSIYFYYFCNLIATCVLFQQAIRKLYREKPKLLFSHKVEK